MPDDPTSNLRKEPGRLLIFPSDATCWGCGYRLFGLVRPVCPECGRPFDPKVPSTYRFYGAPMWARWGRPPSTHEIVAITVLSVLAIIGASGPARWESGGLCMTGLIGVPVWGFLVLFYFRRVSWWLRDSRRRKLDLAASESRGRWRWFVAPLCMLMIFSAIMYPWPLMIRFRLSLPAFENAVSDYRAGQPVGGEWIGLYYVDKVDEITYSNRPPTIGFLTGSSIIDPVGFEYDPLPFHQGSYIDFQVAPSWYTYED